MDGILSKLKNLDAYPKVNEDFFQRTLSGGIITIGSSILMICLFISEFSERSSMLRLITCSMQLLFKSSIKTPPPSPALTYLITCRLVHDNYDHERAVCGHNKRGAASNTRAAAPMLCIASDTPNPSLKGSCAGQHDVWEVCMRSSTSPSLQCRVSGSAWT